MFTTRHALASLAVLTCGTLIQALPAPASGCDGQWARRDPPAGALVVDESGHHPDSHQSLKSAVAALQDHEDEQTIFIMPGVYSEQVVIPAMKGPLILQGYTCDARTFEGNQVLITAGKAYGDFAETSESRDDLTSTLLIKADNVKAYNLNIANTAGPEGHQAVALNLKGTGYGMYGLNVTGFQDTLYADHGKQLFVASFIQGAVDFIFGTTAQLWMEDCEIRAIGANDGFITAQGRNSEDGTGFFAFNNVRVTGRPPSSVYLGRPWRPYARVVFQNSDLGNVIKPEGWMAWTDSQNTDNVFFKEYHNRGPGADLSHRVKFSGVLDKALIVDDVLGKDWSSQGWVDRHYWAGRNASR